MKNILILYPKEFNSYSKFERKIKNIIKNIDNYSFIFINDYNKLIEIFSNNNEVKVIKTTDIDYSNITHAIIFDDGEEFPAEIKLITDYNIPKRVIKILITRVINIKDNPKYQNNSKDYEYIGRGSYWGNPYAMYDNEGDNREDVMRKFEYDFEQDLFLNKKKEEVYKLAGKRLGCFCKPKSCHGDILADFLNSYDDGK